MENLKVSEINSFVPSKDFDLSKRFYQSIGFEVMSEFTDVFIGDNVMIAPNVTIVTKDIPANVVAVGNPCKVVREINERDREYYHKDRRIPN